MSATETIGGGGMTLRYLELFAGAGGLSLGLDAAGLTCVAHAEIEPHARAVLRRHWPDTPLCDDVRQVQGADWPCELVSGGSPCQDLSVAGKRAGLGGARSGLFFEQIRVWEESRAPYLLWENVAGALSSNAGADFAAVLSAIVGGTVPVPSDGWRGAGVVSGLAGVAAWRLLDLQWFGPPQRRRRVFVLGARAGGVDPAAVLLEPESVCRHPAPRRDAREGAAGGAGRGAQGEGGVDALFLHVNKGRPDGRQSAHEEMVSVKPLVETLCTDGHARSAVVSFDWQKGNDVTATRASTMNVHEGRTDALGTTRVPAVLAYHHTQDPISDAVSPSLGLTADGMGVLAFNTKQDGADADTIAPTLLAMPHDASHANGGGQVGVFTFQRSDSYADAPSVASTLGASEHKQQKDIIVEAGHGTASVSTEARGTEGVRALHGAAHSEAVQRTVGRSGCLCTPEVLRSDVHGGCVRCATVEGDGAADGAVSREQGAAGGTVRAVREAERDGCAPQGQEPVQQRSGEPRTDLPELPPSGALAGAPYGVGVPRRLMPIEAERLMSWPDRHTETGLREDGTPYRLSDAARYKLCGNGVGSKCTEWIGRRLMDAHARLRTAA